MIKHNRALLILIITSFTGLWAMEAPEYKPENIYTAILQHKRAPLELDIVKARTPEALKAALPEALRKIENLEQHGYDSESIIKEIQELKARGANVQEKDKKGKNAEEYINKVLILSEPERKELLRALGAPIAEITREFGIVNLSNAAGMIEGLAELNKSISLRNAAAIVKMAIKEHDMQKALNLIRIAMTIIEFKIAAIISEKEDPRDFKLADDILRDAAIEYANRIYEESHPTAASLSPSPSMVIHPTIVVKGKKPALEEKILLSKIINRSPNAAIFRAVNNPDRMLNDGRGIYANDSISVNKYIDPTQGKITLSTRSQRGAPTNWNITIEDQEIQIAREDGTLKQEIPLTKEAIIIDIDSSGLASLVEPGVKLPY